ncbi:unnamed protein product [Polarella glacialis]|uniref:Tubby C-terminal domain-containing protein n=1 Tax=Polarella glacialis TaxID=89957 RepID=A0A813FBI8_POLGL|nr:unnamed protein product [Polarella glacialis]CAE8695303.1 unnamed protein product [Polarella glacialis]|mmetsp:Transcript_29220/g.46900  ORF Transcript_29220/g.46900 Transcript_29220/m.46900 type:complete len:361 (-) Transcript_29220:289-1371(-)
MGHATECSPLARMFKNLSFEGTPEKNADSKKTLFSCPGIPSRDERFFESPSGASPSSLRREPSYCWDAADELEKGCGEMMDDLKKVRDPPSTSDKLERYTIVYQASTEEYQLMSEALDLILVARRYAREQSIEFTFQSSAENQEPSSSSSSPTRKRSPAFSMSHNKDNDEWLLVQTRCDCCVNRPHHLTCDSRGRKQQVACIRHRMKKIEKANVHSLEVHVPPLISKQSALWCPIWTGQDLGSRSPLGSRGSPSPRGSPKSASRANFPQLMPQEGATSIQIGTKLPVWDADLRMLVLTFQDRCRVQSCPRNFMLSLPAKQDDKPIFQHGKVAANTWCLDFMSPLSLVQAFAVAMSSLDWD